MLTVLVLLPHLVTSQTEVPLKANVELSAKVQRLLFINQQLAILEVSKPSQAAPVFFTVLGGLALVVSIAFGRLLPLSGGGVSAFIAVGAALPLSLGMTFLLVNGGRLRTANNQLRKLSDERSALGAP